MVVGIHSAETWQDHPVLAEELAVRQSGVSGGASLGSLVSSVEEVESVNVSGRELSGLDRHVVEESGGLVESSCVGAANVGQAVAGLFTSVLPAVHLDHCHDILHAHALLSRQLCDLANVLVLNS